MRERVVKSRCGRRERACTPDPPRPPHRTCTLLAVDSVSAISDQLGPYSTTIAQRRSSSAWIHRWGVLPAPPLRGSAARGICFLVTKVGREERVGEGGCGVLDGQGRGLCYLSRCRVGVSAAAATPSLTSKQQRAAARALDQKTAPATACGRPCRRAPSPPARPSSCV